LFSPIKGPPLPTLSDPFFSWTVLDPTIGSVGSMHTPGSGRSLYYTVVDVEVDGAIVHSRIVVDLVLQHPPDVAVVVVCGPLIHALYGQLVRDRSARPDRAPGDCFGARALCRAVNGAPFRWTTCAFRS
jgi:hypothetical protein